jgi:hypothetical protein
MEEVTVAAGGGCYTGTRRRRRRRRRFKERRNRLVKQSSCMNYIVGMDLSACVWMRFIYL